MSRFPESLCMSLSHILLNNRGLNKETGKVNPKMLVSNKIFEYLRISRGGEQIKQVLYAVHNVQTHCVQTLLAYCMCAFYYVLKAV